MFVPGTRSGWMKFSLAILVLTGFGTFSQVHGQFMGSSSMGSSGSGSSGGGGGGGGTFLNQQQMDVTKFTNWTSSFDTSSGGSRSGSNGVGSTSILGKSFKSTLGQGLASGSSNSSNFGQPLYNSSSMSGSRGAMGGAGGAGGSRAGGATSRGGRTSTMGGMGGMSGTMGRGTGSSMGGNGTSFAGMSNGSTSRVSAYLTEPIFEMPQRQAQAQGIVSPKAQAEIQEVLSRSPRFQGENAITVSNDGPAVVLRGKVANDRERRIAESMARLTPGVRVVVNELEVTGSPE